MRCLSLKPTCDSLLPHIAPDQHTCPSAWIKFASIQALARRCAQVRVTKLPFHNLSQTQISLGKNDYGWMEWMEELKNGNGACSLRKERGYPASMSDCKNAGWTYFGGVKFEDGFKYTRETCEEGRCNIDESLEKSECEAKHTCTEDCFACLPAKQANPPHLCFAQMLNETQCSR